MTATGKGLIGKGKKFFSSLGEVCDNVFVRPRHGVALHYT